MPSLAVTEVCHLLADPRRRGHPGLAAEFCAAIAADELRVIEATPHDYGRMAELLTTYASLRLQVVDACVIALAERPAVFVLAADNSPGHNSAAERSGLEHSAWRDHGALPGRCRP